MSYLRHMLDGGEKLPLSTNRSENIMGQLALRLKRIGRRWSLEGGPQHDRRCPHQCLASRALRQD